MKLLHLPLDSRPVHTTVPRLLMGPGENLIQPPVADLGTLTTGATVDMAAFLAQSADAAMVSVDAALFGGLVQARQSPQTPEEGAAAAKTLLAHLDRWRDKPVVLSLVIPRLAVTVSNADSLTMYDALAHGLDNTNLSNEARAVAERHQQVLVRTRRVVDVLAQAVAENTAWHLAVYQEDCFPGGPQSALREPIAALLRPLDRRAMFSTGADEMAFESLGVLAHHLSREVPTQIAAHAQPGGMDVIPPFEDTPVGETLGAKLDFLGLELTQDAQDHLWVLTHPDPLDAMAGIDTWPPTPDVPPRAGHYVWVADLVAANGGHPGLLPWLKAQLQTGHLRTYCAMNTAGNALGTCLGMGVWLHGAEPPVRETTLHWRLLEDVGYQSMVRPGAVRSATDEGWFIWNLAEHADLARTMVQEGLDVWCRIENLPRRDVVLPWGRLFEVGPG